MPYLLTHSYFGYTVREKLHDAFDAQQASLFYLGCVGPDVFFFDRIPPSLFHEQRKELGNRLHNLDAGKLFDALVSNERTAQDSAFIDGFLCHFALDAAAHPYIESRTKGWDHTRMEVTIDMQLYRSHKTQLGKPAALQKAADAAVPDALLTAACKKLYGEDYAGDYRRALGKFRFVHRVTYDPHGGKRRFLSSVEAIFHKRGLLSGFLMSEDLPDTEDALNGAHKAWAAPWFPERIRSESFMELFDQGVSDAVQLITLHRNGDTAGLLTALNGRSMSRGPLPQTK